MKPDDVTALIPICPAYIIPDQLHEDFADLSDVPEEFRCIDWIDVSRIYMEKVEEYLNIYLPAEK